jgi:hypothetical protein
MSDAPAPLPHVLSGSRRYCKAGYAIPRPVLPLTPQLAGSSALSPTVIVLAIKLILPLVKPAGRTTVSLHVADTARATHKSP